jgi:hypothetical protein
LRGRQKTQSSGSENSLFSLVRSRTSYLSSFLLSSLYNEAEVAAGPVLAFFVIFLFLWKTKTGQKRPHVMSLESRAAKLLSPVSCVSSSFFSSLSISVFLSLPRFLLYCLLSLLCHLSCIPFSPYLSLSISLFLLLPCRSLKCLLSLLCLPLSLFLPFFLFVSLCVLCPPISWPLSLMAECSIVQLSTLGVFA